MNIRYSKVQKINWNLLTGDSVENMENLFKKVDKKVNTLKTFLQLSDNHQTLLSDHKPKIGDSSIQYRPYCIFDIFF